MRLKNLSASFDSYGRHHLSEAPTLASLATGLTCSHRDRNPSPREGRSGEAITIICYSYQRRPPFQTPSPPIIASVGTRRCRGGGRVGGGEGGEEMPNPEQVVLDMDQNAPPPAGGLSVKPPRSPDRPKTPSTPTAASAKQLQPAAQGRPVLTRLPYSKPKSRFVELNHPLPYSRPAPVSEQNALDSEEEDEEEEDEVAEQAMREKYLASHKRRRRVRWRTVVEWSALVPLSAFLAAALSIPHLKSRPLWGIPLWKWALMLLVVLCGRLVSGWLVSVLAFLIERRFLLEEKVLYFLYGLRRSVQNCLWIGQVLLAWTLLINPAVDEESSNHHRRLLRFMSRALIAVLVGAVIWLIKIFLVKMLASSFHVATFFDRMKVSVFHQYILEALSGPPLDDDRGTDADDDVDFPPPPPKGKVARKGSRRLGQSKSLPARLVGGSGRRGLDMERLRRLSRARATACGVRRLVGHVMSRGLSSSISRAAEELVRGGAEAEITSEWEARCTADSVFKNVAKPGQKYIEEDDLLRFLRKDEVDTIFPLFEGAQDTGKIKKSAFRNWVVRAYLERKSLAHSLNDTKTAVQQLHKIASAVVSIVIIVVSLLVMGVATMKVFLVVTSQLLLVGFMFQNTGKTLFESIIFVFVMHPFDVGDRCVIDGVQMIVEEMNILTTVFLRYDNEKIYYPNSVLLTKPISNFYRSPEMGEMIEFAIDVSTPLDKLAAMKKSIQAYIESKPKHWSPKHSVVVKEIENVNRMKMALNVLHTMNHQNFGEKNNRRSELLLELKTIFESLGIKYHLLPQEVHLTQIAMANGRIPMPVQMGGR